MSRLFFRQSRRRRTCQTNRLFSAAEHAEERVLLSAAPIDGAGNNVDHPEWGSTGETFLRLATTDYGDGIFSVGGEDRPSAREISNAISDSGGEDIISQRLLSAMIYAWGQFIDHDIDLSREATVPEMAPIGIPAGDPAFDPTGTGAQSMMFVRSGYDAATGTDVPREQVNEITAFLDASMVYGSDAERAAALRADGGYLKVSDGDMLPYNDGSQGNAGDNGAVSYLAGDVRANENVELTSMHTLFVREHNRLVDALSEEHPDWDAERLFQEAKAIVEGEIQAITYNEFLPLLLGQDALAAYDGYKADVDPQIANIFATAAFRFGHSMLSSTLLRVAEDGSESAYGHLALRDAFFQPDRLANEGGIDDLLRGAAAGTSQTIDTHLVEDVRSFLFGAPGSGGLDLEALNIQRGRDHGLPDYNTVRSAYG
ncbi:MAG: peroxidase family protein, partial [Planctomycetaceae bacterium]|nr:peroxidase family protein [Planctomycetaceae bacterium]